MPDEQKLILDTAIQAQESVERSQELRKMGQTIAEHLIEQGRIVGLAEGEARGKAEGLREALLAILKTRFKKVPSTLRERIERIRDLDILGSALERAATAKGLSDFKIPRKHRPD